MRQLAPCGCSDFQRRQFDNASNGVDDGCAKLFSLYTENFCTFAGLKSNADLPGCINASRSPQSLAHEALGDSSLVALPTRIIRYEKGRSLKRAALGQVPPCDIARSSAATATPSTGFEKCAASVEILSAAMSPPPAIVAFADAVALAHDFVPLRVRGFTSSSFPARILRKFQ